MKQLAKAIIWKITKRLLLSFNNVVIKMAKIYFFFTFLKTKVPGLVIEVKADQSLETLPEAFLMMVPAGR